MRCSCERAEGCSMDGVRALAQTSRRKQSHRSTSLCRLQCSYMRRRTRSSRSSRCSRSKCVFPLARPANSAIGACMPRCRWAATRPVDAAPGASLRFRTACGVVERCAGVAECDTRGSASERKQQRVIGTRPREPCVAGPADVASARRSAVARIRLRLKLKRRRGDGIRVHCRMDS